MKGIKNKNEVLFDNSETKHLPTVIVQKSLAPSGGSRYYSTCSIGF